MATSLDKAPGSAQATFASEVTSSDNTSREEGSSSQEPGSRQHRGARRVRRKAARPGARESSDSEGDSWTQWEGLSGQNIQTTCSYRQLDTLDGCHEYHLSGFSLAQNLGPGVRLCSDYFEVAGQLWRLEIYPAGVSAEAGSHVSLFLTTPSSNISSNQILHKLAIIDQSGKGHHIVKSRSRVNDALLTSRGIVAAYPKAAKMTHLMTHARHYLPHDTLLIRATVQIIRSWSYDMPPPTVYQADSTQELGLEGLPSPSLQPDMQQYAMPPMYNWH